MMMPKRMNSNKSLRVIIRPIALVAMMVSHHHGGGGSSTASLLGGSNSLSSSVAVVGSETTDKTSTQQVKQKVLLPVNFRGLMDGINKFSTPWSVFVKLSPDYLLGKLRSRSRLNDIQRVLSLDTKTTGQDLYVTLRRNKQFLRAPFTEGRFKDKTPLEAALLEGNFRAVGALLAFGVNPKIHMANGDNAFHVLARSTLAGTTANLPECFVLGVMGLMAAGNRINETNSSHDTPLSILTAGTKGNLTTHLQETVLEGFKRIAAAEGVEALKNAALIRAAKLGEEKTVRAWLDKGANPLASYGNSESAIEIAGSKMTTKVLYEIMSAMCKKKKERELTEKLAVMMKEVKYGSGAKFIADFFEKPSRDSVLSIAVERKDIDVIWCLFKLGVSFKGMEEKLRKVAPPILVAYLLEAPHRQEMTMKQLDASMNDTGVKWWKYADKDATMDFIATGGIYWRVEVKWTGGRHSQGTIEFLGNDGVLRKEPIPMRSAAKDVLISSV